MTGIPNKGTAGAVIDATNSGLTRVEGGAIWVPTSATAALGSSLIPYTPNETTIVEWSMSNYVNKVSTENSVVGDRAGNRVGFWVRLDSDNQGIVVTKGDGTILTQIQTVVRPPQEAFFGANLDGGVVHWRINVPLASAITAEYSTDGGSTWVDVGAFSGSFAASGYFAGDTLGIGAGRMHGDRPFAGSLHSLKVSQGGSLVLHLDANVDVNDIAATTLKPSVGPLLNVFREPSGPSLTLVPSDTVVYVNPDETVVGNRVNIPGDTSFDIAPKEDGVILWAGSSGNFTGGFPLLVDFGLTNESRMGVIRQSASQTVRFDIRTDDGIASSAASYIDVGQPSDRVVLALVMDRSTKIARWRSYTKEGLLDSYDEDISSVVGSISGSLGGRVLGDIPGATSSFMFNKGVGIAPSDQELEVLAKQMIAKANRPAINTTSFAPPVNPVFGDKWQADNGDTALYDGKEWTPLTPATGVNVAVLLGNATLVLDASGSKPGEQFARNRGSGGEALNARYGSTTSADTNDPLLLPHDGENYVYTTGVGGNYLSIPNEAGFDITGDIELEVCFTPDVLGAVNFDGLISKGGQYRLTRGIAGSDRFTAWFFVNGSWTSVGSNHPAVPGKKNWIKATRVQATGFTKIFTRTDDTEYVQSTQNTIHAGLPQDANSSDLTLMSRDGAGQSPEGKLHYATVRNGVGGAKVFEFNAATDIVTGSETTLTATSGQTVTVNRTASGRKTALVTRPIWLLGTDDYLEVPDNDLLDFGTTDELTIVAIARNWHAYDGRVVMKWTASAGYYMSYTGSGFVKMNVTWPGSSSASAPFALGSLLGLVGYRDTATDKVGARVSNVTVENTDGTTATLANATPLLIGRQAGGVASLNAELAAVALWRKALTPEEITALNNYYGTV